MNIHEHQAKEILKEFGASVTNGFVIFKPQEVNEKVSKLKEKSKAKNTQDKYNGDWLKFIDYCKNKYNCSPLDVDDLESAYALTANYMDWLHEDPEAKILKGTSNIPGREKLNNNPYSSSAYKASTIQRILASITYKSVSYTHLTLPTSDLV